MDLSPVSGRALGFVLRDCSEDALSEEDVRGGATELLNKRPLEMEGLIGHSDPGASLIRLRHLRACTT